MNVNSATYCHPGKWDIEIAPMAASAMLARSADKTPDAPLADFLGRTYSYADLYLEARQFAAGLAAQGIGKGDRIGLFLPNVPIYISAYYGAMMVGATVVNFSPLYSVDELAHQVEDSGTRLLITLNVTSLLPTALEVLDASGLEGLIVGKLGSMLPLAKRAALAVLGRKSVSALPRRADVQAWENCLGDADRLELAAIDPDKDLALLQYTGGTTGSPKGAMLTHANLTANAQQVDALDSFDRDGPDIVLGALPLFHVFANTCVLNRTVRRGGCIAMLPRFEAGQVLKTIDRMRPTAFPGVPTMYQALLDHKRASQTDFSSLKICISGGAAISAPLREGFEALSGTRLVEGYGLTESSGVVSVNPYEGTRKPGTIGQVLPATRIALIDKEDPLKAAPDGEPGELIVNGPQVMQGYWNRPDADATTFVEHNGERWLRTGDIAVIDADGYAQIVDRSKDMIAVGGFKVFPSRVEAVLVEHEAVKEALVLGMPDDYMGEMPRAFIALNDGQACDTDAVAKWLNSRIGKHERVDAVVVRDELPKTMIGKLDRKALRAEIEAG